MTCWNWATSWQNLFMPTANNKGADQPAHPRSLISTFVVHCLDGTIFLDSISEISSRGCTGWFVSYLVANPKDRFSRDEAQFMTDLCRTWILDYRDSFSSLQATGNEQNIDSYIIKGYCTDTGEYWPLLGYLGTFASTRFSILQIV